MFSDISGSAIDCSVVSGFEINCFEMSVVLQPVQENCVVRNAMEDSNSSKPNRRSGCPAIFGYPQTSLYFTAVQHKPAHSLYLYIPSIDVKFVQVKKFCKQIKWHVS